MTMDDLIDQFVSDLDFNALIIRADIFKIEHDYTQWLDDDYPDKTDDLSVKVAEAMRKVGQE